MSDRICNCDALTAARDALAERVVELREDLAAATARATKERYEFEKQRTFLQNGAQGLQNNLTASQLENHRLEGLNANLREVLAAREGHENDQEKRICTLEAALRGATGEVSTLRNEMRERCNERNAFRNQMEAFREVALAFAKGRKR